MKVGDRVKIISGFYNVGDRAIITHIKYNRPMVSLKNVYLVSTDGNSSPIYHIESELELDKQWLREEKLKKILK